MLPQATSRHPFAVALALSVAVIASIGQPAIAAASASGLGSASATGVRPAADTTGPAACVETMLASAPVFAAPGPRTPNRSPVRWCESPDSPECQGNDEHPATGLELGRDSGAAHRFEVETLHSPTGRTIRTLPISDGEPRAEHGLGVDRPPSR